MPGCTKNEFVRDHEPKLSESEQKRLIDEYKKKKSEDSDSKKAKVSALKVPAETPTVSVLESLGSGKCR